MNLPDFLASLDGIAYATDPDNRIIAVGGQRWDRFATENGAPELVSAHIIGRDLFDWIAGEEVQRAFRERIAHALEHREPVVLATHCDAPDVERRIRLAITPLFEGDHTCGVLYQAQILEEHARPPVDLFDFKSLIAWTDAQRELPILRMCSFCGRLAHPDPLEASGWIGAERYYALGGTSRVRISHGLCPQCDPIM